jgi:hypothetical protein
MGAHSPASGAKETHPWKMGCAGVVKIGVIDVVPQMTQASRGERAGWDMPGSNESPRSVNRFDRLCQPQTVVKAGLVAALLFRAKPFRAGRKWVGGRHFCPAP